jgi:hypothetical protein
MEVCRETWCVEVVWIYRTVGQEVSASGCRRRKRDKAATVVWGKGSNDWRMGRAGNASDNFRENDFLIRHLVNSTNQTGASNWVNEQLAGRQFALSTRNFPTSLTTIDFLLLLLLWYRHFLASFALILFPFKSLILSRSGTTASHCVVQSIVTWCVSRKSIGLFSGGKGNTGNGQESDKLTFISLNHRTL